METQIDGRAGNKKPQDSHGTLRLLIVDRRLSMFAGLNTRARECRFSLRRQRVPRAVLPVPAVINAHILAGAQRGRDDFTGSIHDPRGCAQREADRTFIALDHDRLPRLIRGNRTGRISRGGCLRCSCRMLRLSLVRSWWSFAQTPKAQSSHKQLSESFSSFILLLFPCVIRPGALPGDGCFFPSQLSS